MCQFRQASEHCYLHEHQLSKKVSELVDDDQKLFWWRTGKQKEIELYLFKRDNNVIDISFSDSGRQIISSIKPDKPGKPGNWSPPIYHVLHNQRFYFKIKLTEFEGKRVSLYISPLYRSVLTNEVPYFFPSQRNEFPIPFSDEYIVEGPGWGKLENFQATQAFWELQKETSHLRSNYIDRLYNNNLWDSFIAIYTITDRVQHSFWKFREPQYFNNIDQKFANKFGSGIDQSYIEVDKKLGTIIRGIKKNDLLVVVSDHGFQRAKTISKDNHSGKHKQEGIFIFYGKDINTNRGFKPNKMLEADILQITPTILYLLGLPVAKDMEGSIIKEVIHDKFLKENRIPEIPSYNRGIGSNEKDVTIDQSTKEQLKSLGYLQ